MTLIPRDEFRGQNRESIGLNVSDVDVVKDERPVCLLIGINVNTFPSRGLIKGIEGNGYRCEFLDWQKIKLLETVEGLADRAITKATILRPDLIICHIQNPEAMMPKTFEALQKIAPVVNMTVDKRENIDWLVEVAPLISLTCFSNSDDVATCEKRGILNTISLHSSCDYDFYSPPDIPYKMKYRLPEIAFIGTNFSKSNMEFPLKNERQEMVEFLQKTYGSKFLCAGMGQQISKVVGEYEELATYRQCKIIIGHNNFKSADYSSDRIFRAMGSGAFFVSSYFPGLENVFEIGKHLEVWHDFDDLKIIIDTYLGNDTLRESVAKAGCEYVRSAHRWQDRVKTIVDTLLAIKK